MTQKEFFQRLLRLAYSSGDSFTLSEVIGKTEALIQSRYPENKHVDAKIRQLLQQLRDDGELEFLGEGRYRLH